MSDKHAKKQIISSILNTAHLIVHFMTNMKMKKRKYQI